MKTFSTFIISTALFISPSAFSAPLPHLNINNEVDNCNLNRNSNLVDCEYNQNTQSKYKWIDTSRTDPFTDEEIHEIRLHPLKYSYVPDPNANIGKVFLIARCSDGKARFFLETNQISDHSLNIAYRLDDKEARRDIVIPINKHYENIFRFRNLNKSLGSDILSSKRMLIKTHALDYNHGKFFAEYELDHFDDASLKTLSYCFPHNEFSRKILNQLPQSFGK